MDVTFHFGRPAEKAPQAAPLAPHEFPEFQKADLCHFDPSVGFDPPEQIWTAPRGEAMASGRIPEKTEA